MDIYIDIYIDINHYILNGIFSKYSQEADFRGCQFWPLKIHGMTEWVQNLFQVIIVFAQVQHLL